MRYTILPLLAGTLLAVVSCTDRPSPVGPVLDVGARTAKVTTTGTGPWARVVTGETGPGSLFALYIPTNWNGDAIYYAHGIRPPADDITLNDQDNFFEVRDALGALGYAFAYSSFSENGLAVKDGVQRTHQLRGLLNSELETRPRRSYLAGYSLGALVAVELADSEASRCTVPPRPTTYISPASSSPNDEIFNAVSSTTPKVEPVSENISPLQ